MTADEFTEKLLCAFRRYYDICTEGIRPPYSATAEFHSLDSRYFLTRKNQTNMCIFIKAPESHQRM